MQKYSQFRTIKLEGIEGNRCVYFETWAFSAAGFFQETTDEGL